MGDSDICEEYNLTLPVIFKQILMVFKDAPTSSTWVLEKLMEVFCKFIAPDLELVKAVNFQTFLDGFQEAEGDILMYPDFVMNNVSLMAAQVLSAHNGCSCLEKSAFSIIRSPLRYWIVSHGHRVDVTFQIFKRWMQEKSMLHLLDAVQFDVSQALVYCLASPHNYTRQSAGDYFIELIKFTHSELQEESENELLSSTKCRLRSAIDQLFQEFNSKLIKHARSILPGSSGKESVTSLEKFPTHKLRASANYCKLLSQSVAANDRFCMNCASTDMFDTLVELLKILVSDVNVDTTDVLRPCTVMLIRLISCSEMLKSKVDKVIQLLLHVYKTENSSVLCDAVFMAGLILTQCRVPAEDQILLVELSLLPLFIMLDVTLQSVPSTCPAAIVGIKSVLKLRQTSKSSGLLKVAVNNLSAIADIQVSKPCYHAIIDYLELKTLDTPREVHLPILNEGNIRNDTILNFIVLKLASISKAFSTVNEEKCAIESTKSCSLLNNIQLCTQACLKFSGISCGQLTAVLDCYLTTLTYIKQCKSSSSSRTFEEAGFSCDTQILHGVLQSLQFKMFDMDPNVREMAVKVTGDLFLIVSEGSSTPKASVDMLACLSCLWQCIDSKTEGVVTSVLEFLLKAAETCQVDTLLSLMTVTQADLVSKLSHFLLSSEWDGIKPVAFNLMTKVCSQDLLVKYAEACFRQDNVRLALAVLEYIQNMFSMDKRDVTLAQKIDTVSSLLVQGWGDLILQKVNASDVCNFRKASSVVHMVLCFMEQQDVCAIIDDRVSECCSSVGIATKKCKRSYTRFLEVCNNIVQVYGCSETDKKQEEDKHFDGQECDFEAGNLEPGKNVTLDNRQKCDFSIKEECRHSLIHLLFTLTNVEKPPSPGEDPRENMSVLNNQKVSVDEMTESAQEKILVDDFDWYLDSTKEMPALTLKTEAFISQKQIQEFLPHTDPCSVPSSATGLLSWFVFQEIFKRINPNSLQKEAHRSTDEYERNSLILLYDLQQVLTKRYLSVQDQVEKELTEHLFQSFSSILNTMLTVENFKKQEVLNEIVRCLHIVLLLQCKEQDIVTFILQNRKAVLKAPTDMDENMFVLDLFLERMNSLSVHGSKAYVRELFVAADELKSLLQLYVDNHKTSHPFLESSTQHLGSEDQPISICAKRVADVLDSMCCELNKSDVLECVLCLKTGELHFLSNVLDGELENLETIETHLKTLQKSLSLQMFQPALQLLQSLIKQLLLVVFEEKSQAKVKRCSAITACYDQLKMYMAEDSEFDGDDNDPSAIDCY